MKEQSRSTMPYRPRFVRRRLRYFFLDMLDLLRGRRDDLTPPRRMYFMIGDADFKGIGEEMVRHLTLPGGLDADDCVLDVGCGVGRTAVPLTRYMSAQGAYEGFDIVPRWIRWCSKAISSRHPNFHFRTADIYNRFYNPKGRLAAEEYTFPYPAGTFDFAFATSVFTHMLPRDVAHYISEISRVLKRGGRCLISYYLLNDGSLRLMEEGKSAIAFICQNSYFTTNPGIPEDCIGYDEKYIAAVYSKCGLAIRRPVHYGGWSGRKDHLTHQDIIIASKS